MNRSINLLLSSRDYALIGIGWILFKPALHCHLNDAKECFFKYAGRHFTLPACAFGEDDGYFRQTEFMLPGQELHFDLEGIAYKSHFIQLYCFQYLSPVANKPRSSIMYGHARNHTNISTGTVRHEHATHWPIDYINSRGITRPNGKIVACLCAGS
jgi:hypothetical protein